MDLQLHFEGKYLKLYTYNVETKCGQKQFERVDRNPVVSIIALKEGKVLLIRENRPELEKVVLKFPGGFVEKNETDVEAAHRELREETGFDAVKLTKIDELVRRSTYNFPESVFLAEELFENPKLPDDDEDVIENCYYSIDDVIRMITTGEVFYTYTSHAFLKYFLKKL